MTSPRDTRAPILSRDQSVDIILELLDHAARYGGSDGQLAEYITGAVVDRLLVEVDRLRAEYVPPRNWPGEAWEPLLDRFFAGELEGEKVKGSYVLLRIPDDIAERIDAARGASLDGGGAS